MTVQECINKYPQSMQDITAINSIFEPYGISVTDIVKGAQIIRYKLQLPNDVKMQGKIRRATKDIEYTLSTALCCDNVVYGKSEDCVYVEKKADSFDVVSFENYIFNVPDKKGLYLILGKDIDGHIMYTDLSKAPHILVAGTTGSGKSELLHSFIATLLFRREHNPCWIYIIDPKRSEFSAYKDKAGIDLITDIPEAVSKLAKCVQLMDQRYKVLEQNRCKDINELNDPNMYPVVVVIDEIADLMMQDRNVEGYLVRLAQKARACGIHLILGTQSPRRDVITGLIKANIPTKIALKTTNQIESRIILDQGGAEKLFGKGDMLFLANGSFTPIRIQAAYVSPELREIISNKLPVRKKPAPTNQTYTNNQHRVIVLNAPQPKPKRTGVIQSFFNIFKAKPMMFKSDDYPPRI